MSTANRLGPIVGMWHVREAVITWAQAWLPDYLADSCRAHGKASDWIAAPASWEAAEEVMKWPQQKLPAIVPGVPGTTGDPARRGTGLYEVAWQMTLGAIVAGIDDNDTELQASIYGAALTQMALQQLGRNDAHGLVGLDVEGKRWRGLTFDPVPQRDSRYLIAASVMFDLTIRNAASGATGLSEPSAPPLGDPGAYPTADTVTVDLALEPITD
jgi:hypothetical protein